MLGCQVRFRIYFLLSIILFSGHLYAFDENVEKKKAFEIQRVEPPCSTFLQKVKRFFGINSAASGANVELSKDAITEIPQTTEEGSPPQTAFFGEKRPDGIHIRTIPIKPIWIRRQEKSGVRKDDLRLFGADLYGIRGYYSLHLPYLDPARQLLFFLDLLSNYHLSDLAETDIGIGFHVQTNEHLPSVFLAIDLSRLDDPRVRKHILPSYLNIPDDFRAFVFEQYKSRLGMTDEMITRLRAISKKTQSRTLLILNTSDSFVQIKDETVVFPNDFFPTKEAALGDFFKGEMGPVPAHLRITGAAAIVRSSSIHEPLPVELAVPGLVIDRPKDGDIAEVGRFTITQDRVSEMTEKLVKHIAATIFSDAGIKKVVIHLIDPLRAKRYIQRYGFKEVARFQNWLAQEEIVLTVTPEELLYRAISGEGIIPE